MVVSKEACGCVSLHQQCRVAQNCRRCLSHCYATNYLTQRTWWQFNLFVSIRVRIQICWKCSQEIHGLLQLIMITHCWVCADILPTLYIVVTIVTVRQKWEVDRCQGLMVGVKIISSSIGSGYIVQWIAGGQEVKLGVVNLLNIFMVAVWAVFDYSIAFHNNAIMVESYYYLMTAKSWRVDLLDLLTWYTRRMSCYWLQAGIEHILLCLPALN